MNRPQAHGTRALTVAAAVVACVLVSAAYTAPDDGAPTDPSVVAAEDAQAETEGEAVVEGSDAAPSEEPQFEHEYEPEPQPTETPAAENDAEPASATPPARDVEHEHEPEPATPPAPAPAPEPDAPTPDEPNPDEPDSPSDPTPDAAESPAPAESAEEPTEAPLAVAGSPAPHPGPPAADDAPDAPAGPDVAGAGGSERTSSSARARAPSVNMTALRSSTTDSFDDDEVLPPLVAPREVARADTPARRATAVTPAGRELLASAGSTVAAPTAFAGSTDAPAPTLILASALLTLVAGASSGAYALQRRRARRAP